MDSLKLKTSSSDESVSNDFSRAKDSLECLSKNGMPSNTDSKPFKTQSCPTAKGKAMMMDVSQSDLLGTLKSSCSSSLSKVLSWDPWDKLARKTKKDNKRINVDKNYAQRPSKDATRKSSLRKDFKSGDECDLGEAAGNHEYKQFWKQSVRFINEVKVVYISNEDKVIGEGSEMLKKDSEQQVRNKEMRKGHLPDTTFARASKFDWFRKN